MSARVLSSKDEIPRARAALEAREVSCLGIEFGERGLWQRIRRRPRARLGDPVKSWDVLQTVEFVEREFPRSARILDIGAYSSEILPVLHRAGYRDLTGIDVNPGIREMPFAGIIRYEVGNFFHAPFPQQSFDVVTAISVIEHGFDAPALLAELARLLVPGGRFIASVDYWPEKIDTSDTKFFGMDWRIFSRRELETFFADARGYGLELDGAVDLGAGQPAIRCAGRDYTFAWLAMRRR